jgi:hypothetical protein
MLTGVCFQAAVDAGVLCRPSAGVCDVEERCNGVATACPLDNFLTGVQCAASTGPCDRPAVCNGNGPNCPVRPLVDAGVVCRGAAGPCDVEERCTGTSAACPADSLASVGTRCGPDGGGCDLHATCTGASVFCPPKPLVDAGVICRQDDVCLPPQRCTGTSGTCPLPPFPLPMRCDDSNLCSIGACLTSGCRYSLDQNTVSRALLADTLDAGVLFIPVPPTMTSVSTPFGTGTAGICTNSNFPPRCQIQLLFTMSNFNAFTGGGQFSGSGTVAVVVPHLPIEVSAPLYGNFQGGTGIQANSCSGPDPFGVSPGNLALNWDFVVNELDGGLLQLNPPLGLNNDLFPNRFCWTINDPLFENQIENNLRPFIANHLGRQVEAALRDNLMSELCLRPGPTGTCALGVNQNGVCMAGPSQCYSGHRFRAPAQPTIPACMP